MKKIVLFLLIIFSKNVFCQDYHFDKFLQYSEVDRAEIIIMTNTKDSSYIFLHKNYGNHFEGRIIDTKNKISHFFQLKNANESVLFEYIDSDSIKKNKIPCYDIDNYYEIVEKPIDTISSNFKILKYKSLSKNTIIETADFDAKKVDYNTQKISSIFFYHFIYCQKITVPYYLPTSIVVNYRNGSKEKTELKKDVNINMVLIVKEKKYKKNK
jgi:hypothetical protein